MRSIGPAVTREQCPAFLRNSSGSNEPGSALDSRRGAESEEDLNSLLMKVNEESEKVGLKLNIQKSEIMASSPITS